MSQETQEQVDFKQVNLKTIIDIDGLIEFYKDDNNDYKDKWGTDPNNPCKADLFSKFIAPDCPFTEPNENIPLWEHSCVFTWEIRGSNEEPLILNSLGEDNNYGIVMEKVKKGDSKKWEDLFELGDIKHDIVKGKLEIHESEKGKGIFTIKTKPPKSSSTNPKYINLSYTINFMFKDNEDKERYGQIDPFIKVRSDDDGMQYGKAHSNKKQPFKIR